MSSTRWLPLCLLWVASCSTFAGRDKISVDLSVTSGEIIVQVTNLTDKHLKIENAALIAVMPDDPGLELQIYDHEVRQQPCGHVEAGYGSEPEVTVLPPRKAITRKFLSRSIANNYCLASGEYKMRVLLRQKSAQYESNEIVLISDR